MKISTITIHNFRSIEHISFKPVDYCLLVGPNNSGKSNILKAILFFFDEIKLSRDDFHKTQNDSPADELCVEVEYRGLSTEERESIKDEYLLDGARLRVRRVGSLATLKSEVHGYERRNGSEVLSENDFFGAKGVGKAKLGDIVFIPAIRDVKDELKPQGSTALATLVKQIITPALSQSKEYQVLVEATQAFERAVRGDSKLPIRELRTYSNLAEIEATLKEELIDWQYEVLMRIKPFEPAEIVRQGTELTLKHTEEPEGPPETKGHGVQRSLLVGLLKILAEAEKATRQKASSSERKIFRPNFTLILFEEPEIFQHPPRQGRLFRDLRLLSERPDLQIILSSHSAKFFALDSDLDSIVVVRRAPTTKASQISGDTKAALREAATNAVFDITTWLNPDRSEMFFSEKVLLLEGAEEKISIPLLASKAKGQLDGMYLLDCGLKTNIKYFMRLCGDLGIPHIVLHDADDDRPEGHILRQENEAIQGSANASTIAIHTTPVNFEVYFGINVPGKVRHRKPLLILQYFRDHDLDRKKLETILPEVFPPN